MYKHVTAWCAYIDYDFGCVCLSWLEVHEHVTTWCARVNHGFVERGLSSDLHHCQLLLEIYHFVPLMKI